MSKKYKTGLKGVVDKLEEDAAKNPYPLILDDRKVSLNGTKKIDAQLLFYKYSSELKIDNWDPKYKTSKRNNAMDAMCSDKVWDIELAKIWGITKEDIIQYYSTYLHFKTFINNECEVEWRELVFHRGRELFEVEVKKKEKYMIGLLGVGNNFLRKLISGGKFKRENLTPRLIVEEKLFGEDDKIGELHNQIELLRNKLNLNEISASKFQEESRQIKVQIRKFLNDKNSLFNELFMDKEANKHFVKIRAVGRNRLYGTTPNFIDLNVSSNRHAKDLIDQYVKWHNELHNSEIQAIKALKKKETDKAYYDAKENVVEQRAKHQEKVDRVLELANAGLSIRTIAKQMDVEGMKVGKSVVQDWIQQSKNK